jgi:hypothetical protein
MMPEPRGPRGGSGDIGSPVLPGGVTLTSCCRETAIPAKKTPPANRIRVGQGIGQVLAASPPRASRRAGLGRHPSRPTCRGADAEWESDEPDTTTDTPADTTPEPEQQPTEQPDPPPGMKWADGKLVEAEPRSREAKYRTELRAAQAEATQLRERLERRDREDVERMIAHRLTDPADLWRGDVSLPDVLDPETGEISPELVDECLARVLKQHPHWGSGISPAAPASLVTSADKPDLDAQQPTWQGLFQQATQPR